MKRLCLLLALGAVMFQAEGKVIKGKIRDAHTGEEIIGANVIVKEAPTKGAVSGLDGTFNLSVDKNKFTLVCSYLGYKPVEVKVTSDEESVDIPMTSTDVELAGVVVSASNHGRSETAARLMEKNAVNVMNVMSQKSIELSPDLTVANVIQRMSGVTMERSSSGEGQYAIEVWTSATTIHWLTV